MPKIFLSQYLQLLSWVSVSSASERELILLGREMAEERVCAWRARPGNPAPQYSIGSTAVE